MKIWLLFLLFSKPNIDRHSKKFMPQSFIIQMLETIPSPPLQKKGLKTKAARVLIYWLPQKFRTYFLGFIITICKNIHKIVEIQVLQNKNVILYHCCYVYDGSVVRHQAGILEIAGSNLSKFSFAFCIVPLVSLCSTCQREKV